MSESNETGQFRSIRTYGEILLVSLLLVHGAVFLAYRWLERNDVRAELVSVAEALPSSGFNRHSDIVQYPDGIIVARRSDAQTEPGFSEEYIAGSEHIVYTVPGTDVIVAKSEDGLSAETTRFGALLAILFVAEVLILFGWWSFLKEKLSELFSA